jgi:triosephosphate isomerase
MNKKYIYVANWKMNLSFSETIKFATSNYDNFVSTESAIVLCPSFESIYPLVQMFKETKVSIGAQACSPHTHGSFTGQVSAQSIHEVGCTHCIVGHSEFRRELCENNERMAQECVHLIDYDISPIICVGETLQEHENGRTIDVIKEQLSPITELIKTKTKVNDYVTPFIAYEPIWSIGSGKVARPDLLDMVLSWLSEYVHKQTPKIVWKFMYGGSIDGKNIAELKKIGKISGFLIGNSSLNFQEFEKIVD